MITALDYIGLDAFEQVRPAQDMVAISIGSPAQVPPANLVAFKDALRLEFLDCDQADIEKHGIPAEFLFQLEQLQQVIAFVQRHHHSREPTRLIVHCQLGSSRSAAIALVAHHYVDCEFPRRADAHFANAHVLALFAHSAGSSLAVTKPMAIEGEPHAYLPLQLQI